MAKHRVLQHHVCLPGIPEQQDRWVHPHHQRRRRRVQARLLRRRRRGQARAWDPVWRRRQLGFNSEGRAGGERSVLSTSRRQRDDVIVFSIHGQGLDVLNKG
jgi:hypothetical protein